MPDESSNENRRARREVSVRIGVSLFEQLRWLESTLQCGRRFCCQQLASIVSPFRSLHSLANKNINRELWLCKSILPFASFFHFPPRKCRMHTIMSFSFPIPAMQLKCMESFIAKTERRRPRRMENIYFYYEQKRSSFLFAPPSALLSYN